MSQRKGTRFWKNERTDFGHKSMLYLSVSACWNGVPHSDSVCCYILITGSTRVLRTIGQGCISMGEKYTFSGSFQDPKSWCLLYIEQECGKWLQWCAWIGTPSWNLLTAVAVRSRQGDSQVIKPMYSRFLEKCMYPTRVICKVMYWNLKYDCPSNLLFWDLI